MELAWLPPGLGALLEEAGFGDRVLRLVRRRPYAGGEDTVFVAQALAESTPRDGPNTR